MTCGCKSIMVSVRELAHGLEAAIYTTCSTSQVYRKDNPRGWINLSDWR